MKRLYFDYVTPVYTGGNIYVFYGKIKNGNYFLACDCDNDIIELDTDPEETDGEDCFFVEWQEEHTIKAYDNTSEETTRFFISMFNWIIRHKPQTDSCNYSEYDIIQRLREYKKELEEMKEGA